ncbi:MAG: efflux RND transporter permease subunit, partial [Verrucomicrobia bacterium]|nr:efflux RND transporter permease subunit [Verrucomicrobiota bacterium]
YGDNPLAAIKRIKEKIAEISPGLPSKTLADGTVSKVTVVPFYDRSGLINETLGTLKTALGQEILITIIVVLVTLMHFKSSLLVSALLPLAVLMSFIGMKVFGVDANVVALSGIAIAIGTIVDMGIVICENIIRHLEKADPSESRLEVVHRAASEVGGAVLTAVLTTVISFLPVFTMIGAEGKLFMPLAFTKTFALIGAVLIALTLLPAASHVLFCGKMKRKRWINLLNGALILFGIFLAIQFTVPGGILLVLIGLYRFGEPHMPKKIVTLTPRIAIYLAIAAVGVLLTMDWEPLGPERGLIRNLAFVALLISGLLVFFKVFQHFYTPLLKWCLIHKKTFLALPLAIFILGMTCWLGFEKTFGWLPEGIQQSPPAQKMAHTFPGFGKEFMPNLDEGSFLFMPTTMTHASIGETIDIIQKQDMAIQSIPEIESVVGKLGRAETPLDPAPISMIETVINYIPEYKSTRDGQRINFKYNKKTQDFVRDEAGELIEDRRGRPYRQWRDHIKTPDDIWDEIVKAAKIPGTTSAPKLQPIAARIVMLASGMRAPMGVKVQGPDLDTIEKVGLQIEQFLKEVPSVEPSAVIADRIVGKPYLEIVPDRESLARYGIPIRKFQDIVEIAIGGRKVTGTVEGRERFPVRVRYQRELRDHIEALDKILIPGINGQQIPITELAEIKYVRGPQNIKSEDTFLIGYVVFDKKEGYAEVDVVEQCQAYLQSKIDSGEFILPRGVSYRFAGNYENQLRASKTLAMVMPIALFAIFLLIYLQFKSTATTLLVFTGVFIAWSGGFILIWLYGQPWFLDISLFGVEMRNLFQVHTINMSVAVWVGFLALFGIATDDGVVMGTYLTQTFRKNNPSSIDEIRALVVQAGNRRVRACLMTTATTILALLPVLTATGSGSDIMIPMAIPSFGGMLVVLISIFVVPVLYCALKERKIRN